MAKLPNGDKATLDIRKLTDYCLNPDHIAPPGRSSGKDKARLWQSMLGVYPHDAEWLKAILLEVARTGEATPHFADEHGQRYEIKFLLVGKNGESHTVKSGWIIDAGATDPRFTTSFPEAVKKV